MHPGGPFWKKRDEGAWSIPKGEIEGDEHAVDVARREFQEELGLPAPSAEFNALGWVKQAGGKVVHAWAVESDVQLDGLRFGTFEMEWPPRSGRKQAFPEVDRAEWFDVDDARRKIVSAQATFLDRLTKIA